MSVDWMVFLIANWAKLTILLIPKYPCGLVLHGLSRIIAGIGIRRGATPRSSQDIA